MLEFLLHNEILLFITITVVGIIAGFFNALAGGGTFFVLPILLALGVPAIQANVTSAASLWSGYVGSAYLYKTRITQLRKHMIFLCSTAIIGSFFGSVLLLTISNQLFGKMIPFLILFSSLFFFISQNNLSFVQKANKKLGHFLHFMVSVYGGFFGAGMGILIMVVLPFVGIYNIQNNLALKYVISLCIALTSLIIFAMKGYILWEYMLFVFTGATIGGMIGARFSQRMKTQNLYKIVVFIGLLLSIYYFNLYWLVD